MQKRFFLGILFTFTCFFCFSATADQTLKFCGLPYAIVDETWENKSTNSKVQQGYNAVESQRFEASIDNLSASYYLPTMRARIMSDLLNGQKILEQEKCSIMSIYFMDPKELFYEGKIIDLSESQQICSAFKNVKGVPPYIADADGIYAIPQAHHLPMLQANQEILKAINIDCSEIITWDDLFSLSHKVEDYNKKNQTDYKLITCDISEAYWFTQYLHNVSIAPEHQKNNRFDLNTLLLKWKALLSEGLINDRHNGSFNSNDSLLTIGYVYCEDMKQNYYIDMPSYDGCRYPYVATSQYYVVPVDAYDKDAALAFLQRYISPETVYLAGDLRYGILYEDLDSYIQPQVSENNLNLWSTALSNSTLYDFTSPEIYCQNIIAQYVNDELDLDEASRLIQDAICKR